MLHFKNTYKKYLNITCEHPQSTESLHFAKAIYPWEIIVGKKRHDSFTLQKWAPSSVCWHIEIKYLTLYYIKYFIRHIMN